MLLATAHELARQHRAGRVDRQITDLIHHHERRSAAHRQAVPESTSSPSSLQRVDELGEGAVASTAAPAGRGDGQADGQLDLADAWGPSSTTFFLRSVKPSSVKPSMCSSPSGVSATLCRCPNAPTV